ncbi:MAG: SDR family NAD(P)-dependent oxidoreductase [Bacteroidota bacterium]|nr:SDR family NAD(P)-dependent oxidoreductase [Bacteroidota bacterium]
MQQINFICDHLPETVQQVIFISSTSVYPEGGAQFDEESGADQSHELFIAEELLKKKLNEKLLILRCGGLMGYERVPGKYFAGKIGVRGGNNPVNYVHRDDVIRIILKAEEDNVCGETFNVVAPVHPLKKEVALKTIRQFNLSPPQFEDEKANHNKLVNPDKLIRKLKYKFKYPDPMKFYYELKDGVRFPE